MAIERKAISQQALYVAIKNETYVQLADQLGIRHTYYSSANNTGNVIESLCWLAYEQKKYNFILSIVRFAADFEYPDAVAPGPAAAVAPGPAKLRRRQTSAPPSNQAFSQSNGSASWRRRVSSQRDVEETAASASGHPAAPASSESSGRRVAVQDRQPSEDEEDYGEHRCMSTWTKAKLEDYAKLNKHELGRQEEMERQAAWIDLQAEDENAKRQERSNRGQTLEMLRRTTTVPDTDLPMYLDAYLSLCATEPEAWDRRFEILEEQFRRPWARLRIDMAISVAEPKRRSEEEVDEAHERFKLAYKEACEKRFSKQRKGPWKKFIRDIFQDKKELFRYLRIGPDWL